jgi:hypothetical protein
MESNGESNKIHVSQMTADLIDQAGKGYVGTVIRSCFYFSKENYVGLHFLVNTFSCEFLWYGRQQTLVNHPLGRSNGQRERFDANVLVRPVVCRQRFRQERTTFI